MNCSTPDADAAAAERDVSHRHPLLGSSPFAYVSLSPSSYAISTPFFCVKRSTLPLNHFSDQLRDEVARAGYTEVLTHGLCMTRENFDFLKRPNDAGNRDAAIWG